MLVLNFVEPDWCVWHFVVSFYLTQVTRNALRFARKYYGAQLLSCRLYQSDNDVSDALANIRETAMHKNGDSKLTEIVKLPTGQLQQWVRASFMCDAKCGPELRRYIATTVKPALACSVSSIPESMVAVMGRFTAIVAGSEASEEDCVNLRIASAALSGELSQHPLIQGLVLQCRRMVDKANRGIDTMQGRRSRESDREKALVADAGLTLALHAGNASLAKEFGLAASFCRIDVDMLKQQSLPTPALAILWPDIMKENWTLAEQRFPRHPDFPKRFLD